MKAALCMIAAIALVLAPAPARTRALASARTQTLAAGGVKAALPLGLRTGTYQKSSIGRLLGGTASPVESLDVVVFMVSFADVDFDDSHDAVYLENELRHLKEYYLGASRNVFTLSATLYPVAVKLSGTEAYYGDDVLWKERMAELLIELVQKTDEYVDFSAYDAYAVIHAGAGQETDFNGDSEYQIASGFMDPSEMAEALADTIGTPGVPTNDLVNGDTLSIDNLMIWPEDASQDGYTIGSLGIYAYQVGLRLGMVPLYDTTPEEYADSQGIGNFDLMGYGIYNALGFVPAFPSAFNRLLMGWVQPIVVSADGDVRIADVNSTGVPDTALVKICINSSEYFLVENRVHDMDFNGEFDFLDLNGNGIPESEDTLRGAEFDFFLTSTTDLRVSRAGKSDSVITGSGLMVYHVDEAAISRALDAGGYPNDCVYWKGVDIEEADHIQDLDSPSGSFAYGSFYDSFRKGNNDQFGPDTDPSTIDNGGARTGIEFYEISSAGRFMTFKVRFLPAMDFARGEFKTDIARLSPVAVAVGGDDFERLLMAADSADIYLADVGLEAWDGEVEKLDVAGGGIWTAPPVVGCIVDDDMGEMYLTSVGGILHACDWTGGPVAIDDDGTPGTLRLHGDSLSTLIVGPALSEGCQEPILAFSSTADSTYLMILGYDGTWPGAGWLRRGPIGIEFGLLRGRIASHPAYGIVKADENTTLFGAYIATYDSDGGLYFNYIPLKTNDAVSFDPADIVTEAAGVFTEPNGLLTISAGDIDRDGSDEMVAAVDDAGLFYFEAGGVMHRVRMRGSHPSPPVLADVDGDGTLETAIRDGSHCYLYSGFGVSAGGWPVAIDGRIVGHESLESQTPPVVGDVNGDDKKEIIFLIAGDIHAFDFRGGEIDGWPLPGEGERGGALALIRGESDKLYVAACASVLSYAGSAGAGAAFHAVSSIRRYDPGIEAGSMDGTWRMYRHDWHGYGRQANSEPAENQRTERVDPSTFIIYPNPAAGSSLTVRLLISAPARVKVTFVDIEGEKVVALDRSHNWFGGSAVPFEQSFSTARFSGGVYICRLEVIGDGWSWSGSKKIAVIR
jgi:M6 family metalloprotease-like protein